MSLGKVSGDEAYLQCLEELQKVRRFNGEPARFWSTYLRILVTLTEADHGLIAIRNNERGPRWQIVAVAPQSLLAGSQAETLLERMEEAIEDCLKNGSARWELDNDEYLAIRLEPGNGQDNCLAAFGLKRMSASQAREKVRRLQLAADVPAGYQLQRVAVESRIRVEHFANVLDLLVLVNAEKRFLASAMTFCNELASRHQCERVSLGWLYKGYVRLQAMSHVDRFDRKMEAVQKLEVAMEEALDQNCEVVLPPLRGGATIGRDHQAFAQTYDVTHICSVPLRVDEEPVAVCTCERSGGPFTEVELRLLRLSCDQAARRLADLKRSDRWFGARLAAGVREKLGRLVGYEHTWAKVLAILFMVLLGTLVLGKAPYRIKAPVILRTDDVAYLSAPFDGHIDKVWVRVGDEVRERDNLLSLDQSDLLLREAELVAEKNRYEREFDKARASNVPADMRITQALRAQAVARLDLVRYLLSQSVVLAPFDGVIVEGDLMERIGSPVQQGDILFKLARIERLYAELEVSEADIHQVRASLDGEIALASQPQDHFPIRMFRIEPVAVAKEEGNVFIVHCNFPDEAQGWWRPGMTGVARLNAGRRRLIWILTHRTVDFLRLRLWW